MRICTSLSQPHLHSRRYHNRNLESVPNGAKVHTQGFVNFALHYCGGEKEEDVREQMPKIHAT